jgi:hypothetical protein
VWCWIVCTKGPAQSNQTRTGYCHCAEKLILSSVQLARGVFIVSGPDALYEAHLQGMQWSLPLTFSADCPEVRPMR